MLLNSNNIDLNSFPLSVVIIILPKAVFSFQFNIINMILKKRIILPLSVKLVSVLLTDSLIYHLFLINVFNLPQS